MARWGAVRPTLEPVGTKWTRWGSTGVRMISSAARACKTKHSGVVTQRHAGILPTALQATSGPLGRSAAHFGSSGDNVDPVGPHWGPPDPKCRQGL